MLQWISKSMPVPFRMKGGQYGPEYPLRAILFSKIHVIVCMRSKMEYALQKNEHGKQVPQKVGMAPIMRDGVEYEFTTVFDLDIHHQAQVSKDRTQLFGDSIFMITEDTGKLIIEWLNQSQLNVEIYKKLYGERVNVIDTTDVAHKGRITQHTRYSYSRNSLKSRLDGANSKLSKRPTITFKSFNDSIQDATPDMWFGNCSGYNQYTGESINMVGCPHKHNAQYLLIGKVLGENVDQFNREFKLQPVEWGGFRFNFNTFTNKGLQKIQLSLIEIELIQAAGRARALREDVDVDIYANLPLRIIQKFVAD